VYASLVSLMLDGFVMRILLMRRAYVQRQAQRATELELQRSEEESKARRQLSEEQSRLFAMLAHEMKTPLATLRMWVHAGAAGRPAMERAISEMTLIIERCVHTGQLAEKGLQPIAQAGDALLQARAGIETSRDPDRFELRGPDGAAPILADMQMLSIVLVNLFDNAAKYSAPQSPIRVLVQAQARDGHPGWCWQISNVPGPAGMPDPARLFEKYYRSPGARHQSGSGLGLFLVRGLLDLMGGTVQFQAQDGWAVFDVWLPATPVER
jgi:signal transduction histidine kinase